MIPDRLFVAGVPSQIFGIQGRQDLQYAEYGPSVYAHAEKVSRAVLGRQRHQSMKGFFPKREI